MANGGKPDPKMKMHGTTATTWTDSPHMPQEHGTSIKSHNALGSGSRPTKSDVKIETSAPMDPHTQGRDVPGSLK